MLRRMTPGDVPNTLWPSDNDQGIPTLRLDRQATQIDLPFTTWGRATRKSRMQGTWHFYTEDYRFSAIWSRPQVVVNSACVAAVEPNFSVNAQTPPVVAAYQTYMKRWLARLWQEQGINVLVDLHVDPVFWNQNLVGIPKGWAAFATRSSPDVENEFDLAVSVAGRLDPLFVVYGGGAKAKELCQKRGWLHFQETILS